MIKMILSNNHAHPEHCHADWKRILDDGKPYDRLGMNDRGLQNSDLFRERSLKHDRVKVSGSVDNDPCKSK